MFQTKQHPYSLRVRPVTVDILALASSPKPAVCHSTRYALIIARPKDTVCDVSHQRYEMSVFIWTACWPFSGNRHRRPATNSTHRALCAASQERHAPRAGWQASAITPASSSAVNAGGWGGPETHNQGTSESYRLCCMFQQQLEILYQARCRASIDGCTLRRSARTPVIGA